MVFEYHLSLWCVHEQIGQVLLILPLSLLVFELAMRGSVKFAQKRLVVSQRDSFYFYSLRIIWNLYFLTFTRVKKLNPFVYFYKSIFLYTSIFYLSKECEHFCQLCHTVAGNLWKRLILMWVFKLWKVLRVWRNYMELCILRHNNIWFNLMRWNNHFNRINACTYVIYHG